MAGSLPAGLWAATAAACPGSCPCPPACPRLAVPDRIAASACLPARVHLPAAPAAGALQRLGGGENSLPRGEDRIPFDSESAGNVALSALLVAELPGPCGCVGGAGLGAGPPTPRPPVKGAQALICAGRCSSPPPYPLHLDPADKTRPGRPALGTRWGGRAVRVGRGSEDCARLRKTTRAAPRLLITPPPPPQTTTAATAAATTTTTRSVAHERR